MRWLDSSTDAMDMNFAQSPRYCAEEPDVLLSMELRRAGPNLATEQQQ